MDLPLLLYGFLTAIVLIAIAWFAFVLPSERRQLERKLALVQKRIAEREARQAEAIIREESESDSDDSREILETRRLRLRKLTTADAPFMLALLNDPAFHQYIGDRGVQSEAQARDYIKHGAIASYAQFGYGMYLAELKSDGRAAGICGLVRRDGLDDPDLGFAFMPEFRSQGLATEAASAVLRHAVNAMALPRVVAIVTPDNQASIALLQKAGMRQDGTVRLPGGNTDLDLYVYEV